jgi:DNA-directed RNA polymerase specialized sigma24 family protein
MGDTDGTICQLDPADECPAMSTLRESYYLPLVRLAALLTGDADEAEAVACAALAALRTSSPFGLEPDAAALHYLQHQVLIRTRRGRRPSRPPTAARRARRGAQSSALTSAVGLRGRAQPGITDFADLPVVRALQDLPRHNREAVVLTHYLDLSEQQAARLAGVAQVVLRARLGQAMRTLQDRLPEE